MRINRFSLAHFLTLFSVVFVLAAEPSALAQGKGQAECPDTPVARPVRIPARPPARGTIIINPSPQPTVLWPRSEPPRPVPRATPPLWESSPRPWWLSGPGYTPPLPEPIGPPSPFALGGPADSGGNTATFAIDLTGIDAPDRIIYKCIRDGRIIYYGSDPGEMCVTINRDIAGEGVSIIEIQPEGLNPQKQDALITNLARKQSQVNPNVSVILSSPGARLVESSTEPKPAAGDGLYESTFKLEKEGKTGRLRIFNRVRERLRYFLFELRNLMSSELKYMSAERVVKKAIADFQKTHPGPQITVEFISEAGATHWVRVPPLQSLGVLWLRS